jgi:exodeoxyribonuclease V beta subunit
MEFTFPLAGTAAVAHEEESARWQVGPGFVRGFIDLIFRWQERYYIVDWKSNHLGNDVTDYHPEAIAREMDLHNYSLQYRIYIEALRRHLGFRCREFDFARHFGGVYYLFLRGIDPARGPRFGVFQARPASGEMDRFVEKTLTGLCT